LDPPHSGTVRQAARWAACLAAFAGLSAAQQFFVAQQSAGIWLAG